MSLVQRSVLGALYLLYLARRLWSNDAGTRIDSSADDGHRGLAVTGILVALGNPKTMLFYLALTPTILPMGVVSPSQDTVAALVVLVLAIYGAVLATYTALAARARHLLQSPGARIAINRIGGAVLVATALLILLN
jgi:threonine/homoserine/homoserine lactone efflux protein